MTPICKRGTGRKAIHGTPAAGSDHCGIMSPSDVGMFAAGIRAALYGISNRRVRRRRHVAAADKSRSHPNKTIGLDGTHVMCLIHGATFGGPHNQCVRLADWGKEHGVSVAVVVPSEPGAAAARLREAGVPVLELPLARPRRELRTLLEIGRRYPAQVRALAALFSENGTDIVQVHGFQGFDGALAARMIGLPVVWQIIDTRPPMWLRRVLMPLVLALADVVMTTGQGVADVYPGCLELGDRLVTFIPPVSGFEVPDRSRRDGVRYRLGVEPNEVLVVSVGNQNPQKGFELVIRVAARISALRPQVKFVIRGAAHAAHQAYADHLAMLARAVPRGIVSLGEFTDEMTVHDLLAAADIFVLASTANSEGLPTVLLEALASGVPAIATRVGSVCEAVTPDVGLIVEPGDDDAMLQALLNLLDHRTARAEMAARAPLVPAKIATPEAYGQACLCAYRRAEALAYGGTP